MIRISLLQRLLVSIIALAILAIGSSGFGFWYAASVETNLAALRNANAQLRSIYDLQLNWTTLVKSVDDLLLTRYVSLYQVQLTTNTAAFKRELTKLAQGSFGVYPQTIEANRQILRDLEQISVELDQAFLELNTTVLNGRWTSATTLRQTRLATLQRSLVQSLQQLEGNIQNDVNLAAALTAQLQQRTRSVWVIANVFAIILAGLIAWATQRWISGSIQLLTRDVRRITTGDFSPVTPLKQQDEIGDLSRAFAMMTNWLRESYESLEQRVAERTLDLGRRNLQLQVAAEVARDIAATRRLDDLLIQSVNLIRDRFGFYHAGIFLSDERGEFAMLRSATGLAGQEMLARDYKLAIGEQGLVGYVCYTGQARIALEVDLDQTHLKNPWLPDTRSEAVLPLKARGQVIGALDVQSKVANAFDQESISILQLIADQLATAIQNSRLFQELQDSLREVETAYGGYGRQAWSRYLERLQSAGASLPGYSYDGTQITPASLLDASSPAEISIPLQVRGVVIGTLDVWPKSQDNGSSGLTPAEIQLLTAVSSRISQALEAARLYEESLEQAAREQLVSEIMTRVRASLDVQTVLQTALKEMSTRLGLPRIDISLGLERGGSAVPIAPESGVRMQAP